MATQEAQLRWTALHHPTEVAATDLVSGASITFSEWSSRADALAHWLAARGVAPADRVALHLESDHVLRWITAYAAVHRCGAAAVPINTRLTATETRRLLAHAEPTLAITSSTLRHHHPDTGPVLIVDDDASWADAVADDVAGAATAPRTVTPGDDDVADIMYTSGTTGSPKGIVVRHRNTHIIPNGEPRWTGQTWLHCSPLFTFAGISFVYNPMKMGMGVDFLPRFEVNAWIDAVEQRRPSCAFLVPAMVQLLAASTRFGDADLDSLTLVSIGSAPLPPSLHRSMADRLPNAMVSNNYSMTEAGTAFTHLPPAEIGRRPGSVGKPIGIEVLIADEGGREVGPNTVGEVLLHVGDRQREYFRDPEATAATWSDGWLQSGDLGELDDDGYLYIRGRKKDVIIRGGHNVVGTDVESVLYEHPAVLEAAVVALPHPILGEDVGAAIVVKHGAELTSADLAEFCVPRLADYMRPRVIWFVDALPRNATGKVLKHEIALPRTVLDDD